jgi:RND superfamily putative drug exporter
MQARNFAARAGRWSAQHRRKAILGWIAFVVAAVLIGGAIGTKHIDNSDYGTGESGAANKVLNDKFNDPASEQVLI